MSHLCVIRGVRRGDGVLPTSPDQEHRLSWRFSDVSEEILQLSVRLAKNSDENISAYRVFGQSFGAD